MRKIYTYESRASTKENKKKVEPNKAQKGHHEINFNKKFRDPGNLSPRGINSL